MTKTRKRTLPRIPRLSPMPSDWPLSATELYILNSIVKSAHGHRGDAEKLREMLGPDTQLALRMVAAEEDAR